MVIPQNKEERRKVGEDLDKLLAGQLKDRLNLPKQLQNINFRFVLLGKFDRWFNVKTKEFKTFSPEEYANIDKDLWKPRGKTPFEKDWQNTNNYKFNDKRLLEHIQLGKNFGVIGGYGNLRILDIDKPELAEEIEKKINTFTIKTGSGGRHFYFISDYDKNHVLINELGELRCKKYQVVSPPCRHPSGKYYKIINDVPIKEIKADDLIKLIKPYLKKDIEDDYITELGNKLSEAYYKKHPKDTSRSGLEYRKCIALFRDGKTRQQVQKEMQAYAKWINAPEQYRQHQLDNAERFVLDEKEKGKEIKKEISEDALKLLKDTNLFNNVTKEFNKKIVGEEATIKVIFLCAYGGRLVENCNIASYNLLVNDDAGTGKDYVVGKVLELLPKEQYIHKTRISPTTFTYWHNQKDEPDWTWNGKVFYPEDISELVLNSDVFKVMCSSGTSATITIKNKAVDIEIAGKPVMITTTASAVPNPELVRRFVILNLDGSEEQTKAIMKRHSEFKKTGIVPEYNYEYKKAFEYLKRVKVNIPYSDLIHEHFPIKNVIMRTHYTRFLDYICASAGLHQLQRETNEDGFVLANGQDYDIARECFLKLTSNKFMIPLTINQKKILGVFDKEPYLKNSASRLHTQMNFLSLPALITNLGILVKYGILKMEIEKDNWNRDLEVYSLSEDYNPNKETDLPKYKELTLTPLVSKLPLTPLVPLIPNQKNEVGSKGDKGIKPIKCLSNSAISNKIVDAKEYLGDD